MDVGARAASLPKEQGCAAQPACRDKAGLRAVVAVQHAPVPGGPGAVWLEACGQAARCQAGTLGLLDPGSILPAYGQACRQVMLVQRPFMAGEAG